MRDRGVSEAVIADEANYLAGERAATASSDGSKYKDYSDADMASILEESLPQWMKRTLSGADVKEGGYGTDIDDTGTEWVPGEPFQPGDPGQTAQTFRAADEGQKLIPYETPEYLTNLSQITDIRELVKAYYERFLGRTPSEEEVDRQAAGGYQGEWRHRIHNGILNSPEYVYGDNSAESQIRALYQKYYNRAPSNEELMAGKGNPNGPAGVENLLLQYPTDEYRKNNPVKPFRAADPGQEAREYKAATAGTPAGPGSWSQGIPTMKDIVSGEDDDPDLDDPGSTDPPIQTAQPFSAPPKIPYSARGATIPYTSRRPTTGSVTPPPPLETPVASTALSTTTGTAPTTGAAPFIGTMGGVMPPPPVNELDTESWNAYNNPYLGGGADHASVAGGFNPAPWSDVGNRLARVQPRGERRSFGDPELIPEGNEAERAYDFGVREGQTNQRNANLGARSNNDQMARWIQSWNDWNRRGVDPFERSGGF